MRHDRVSGILARAGILLLYNGFIVLAWLGPPVQPYSGITGWGRRVAPYWVYRYMFVYLYILNPKKGGSDSKRSCRLVQAQTH